MYTQVLLALQGGEALEFQALEEKAPKTVSPWASVCCHSPVPLAVAQYRPVLLLWDTLEAFGTDVRREQVQH